ncbi:enoyl-CoA hydratase/isomerase family protein [Coraliomargarita akajimensis]|uniref:Enoyl-CoA hydratase/isomerase n=1 Tax=Coraliomargarita akajimensis (strain DSM 45221 / IAM 15411 / JCM 23193 / KCTC 12865 / 04OKA010-24) TaxID=583355 RepID=D5ELS2_CORAD|nr:enoyl-CoA hydratase-related protein [Coraliomargarita akajimensis]ADE53247.1 Enoyl-CoA hydratase/isomerase [Coraliomargarita akajimensis DSM 45221]
MSEAVVSFSSLDGIGRITFNRPPANAYQLQFHQQFNAAIEAADADASTRVVIIESALDRFFCAGADIKAFADNSVEDNKAMVLAAQSALAKIEASAKPFIACIAGHCLGGGLEIAMACDIRFGAEGRYKLGLPETKLGLLPGNGGSQRLPRIVGPSQAFLLLASGESIEPAEALRIGLINRLFPAGEFRARVEAFARSIAESAPLAVAACKQAVWGGAALELKDALQLETDLLEDLYDTEDAKEGFQSFVEKRAPIYRGR